MKKTKQQQQQQNKNKDKQTKKTKTKTKTKQNKTKQNKTLFDLLEKETCADSSTYSESIGLKTRSFGFTFDITRFFIY